MFEYVSDLPKKNLREITFSYDPNSAEDMEILDKISVLLCPCAGCINYYLYAGQYSMCRAYHEEIEHIETKNCPYKKEK